MKHRTTPDQNRRRRTARRIAYRHPETDLAYIRQREVRQQAQREEDLSFLRDLLSH